MSFYHSVGKNGREMLGASKIASGLHDRIEEIYDILRVLLGDVRRLEKALGQRRPVEIDSDAAGLQRCYVRAVFALIEAVVEQHRLLLLDLSAAQVVTLENGATLESRKMKRDTPLSPKIEAVYKAAGQAFGQLIEVACEPLKAAKDIRNRLTHPKSFHECDVFLDLDKVREAEKWFCKLNNNFVAAAKQHRKAHDNWRVPNSPT
jgi:hypothetical protein